MVNRLLESLLADALRTPIGEFATNAALPTHAVADRRIGRVLARFHEDVAASWTLQDLAEAAAMSRSAFSDRFRSMVGESPMRYLAGLRLDRSARLLRSTDATVAEIARRVGYGSQEALSRAFKTRFGASPSAYRAQARPATPQLAPDRVVIASFAKARVAATASFST